MIEMLNAVGEFGYDSRKLLSDIPHVVEAGEGWPRREYEVSDEGEGENISFPAFYTATQDIIGWKKVYTYPTAPRWSARVPVIAKLRIPAGTIIHCAHAEAHQATVRESWMEGIRKCRAERAIVEELYKLVYDQELDRNQWMRAPHIIAFSGHDTSFEYLVGKTVSVPDFSREPATCRSGIHFFVDILDAGDY